MRLEIRTDEGRVNLLPGEGVCFHLGWFGAPEGSTGRARLVWWIEGSGDADHHTVAEHLERGLLPAGELKWEVDIPSTPYSYRGKAFSIRWGVEFEVAAGGDLERLDLVIGPGGMAVGPEVD